MHDCSPRCASCSRCHAAVPAGCTGACDAGIEPYVPPSLFPSLCAQVPGFRPDGRRYSLLEYLLRETEQVGACLSWPVRHRLHETD